MEAVIPKDDGDMNVNPVALRKSKIASSLLCLHMIASLTGCSPTKVNAWKNRWGWKSLADIVVFDPDTVIERADYSHPQEYPDGIEWVVVNGQITVSPDGHTGARAGRTL